MLKKLPIIALFAAASLWCCAEASANSYKMYQYSDAAGKRYFVNALEDVPNEFRLSASAVVVVKDYSPGEAENGGAAKEGAANGGAVTVLTLNLAATEDGKCGFNGEVKNEMKIKAENVKLHLDVKTKDGTRSLEVPVGAGGMMNPGETAKVAHVADVPAKELAGYSYNVTWQTTHVETPPPPAKPAEGQPPAQGQPPVQAQPPQAATPKENPPMETVSPPPATRYRSRNRPAAAPAEEKKE